MVPPAVLGRAAQHQHVAILQQPFEPQAPFPALHQKAARGAETDRGDHRITAQFRLVVAVPTHAVPAIAIPVEQYAVESNPGQRFHPFPQALQRRSPRRRFQPQPGVGIDGAGIAVPGAQPRRGDPAAVQGDDRLLPRCFPVQRGEQPGAVRRRERPPIQHALPIRQFQPLAGGRFGHDRDRRGTGLAHAGFPARRSDGGQSSRNSRRLASAQVVSTMRARPHSSTSNTVEERVP